MSIPTLFGSEWTLIAIVVVVLLLAVLGLLFLRKRRTEAGQSVPGAAPARQLSKADKAAAKAQKGAAKPVKPTRESRKLAALQARADRDAAEVAVAAQAAQAAGAGAYPAGADGMSPIPSMQAPGAMAPVPGMEQAPAVPGGGGIPSATAGLGGPATQVSVDDLFAAGVAPPSVGAGAAPAAAAAAPFAGAPPAAPAPAPVAAPAGGGFLRGKPGKSAPQGHAEAIPSAAFAADPLQAVIASILAGWGDLTTEDTNRLEVFRRDRVLAAIAAIEPPKESKGSEYAKTRWTQLRRYASYLEQGAKQAASDPSLEHEFAGIPAPGATGPGAAPAPTGPGARGPVRPGTPVTPAAAGTVAAGMAGAMAGAASRPAAPTPVSPALRPTPSTPAPPTPSTQPAATAGADAADAAPSQARSQTRSWYSTVETDETQQAPAREPVSTPVKEPEIVILKTPPEVEIPRPAPAQPRDWTSSPVGDDTAEVDITADRGMPAAFDWGTGPEELAKKQPELKAVDLSWGNHEPAPAAAPQPAAVAPTAPAPFGAPILPAEPAAAAPFAVPVTPPAPPATPAEPPAPPAPPTWGSADEASKGAEAAVAAAAAAFWGTPDAPRLERAAATWGRKVSTAADIMALPAGDRHDMLAFLEPPELAKVFKLSGDRELKKAVIDTLEHIGNTASLDVIHESLDDTDPEVQLHALDAADRMLGKGI